MDKKITYKYSLFYDLQWMYLTLKKRKWLQEKRLIYFTPSLSRMVKLWFNRPKGPNLSVEFNVTCYWVSSGTWGAYRFPDKIFICAHKLDDMKRVIMHEIIHLKYDNDVKHMTHEEKEDYINKKTNTEIK